MPVLHLTPPVNAPCARGGVGHARGHPAWGAYVPLLLETQQPSRVEYKPSNAITLPPPLDTHANAVYTPTMTTALVPTTPATSSEASRVEDARQALRVALRERYIANLPALVQEWEDSVRLSEDPKHYKDFVNHITEVLELKPRPDARDSLPSLHINILGASGNPLVAVGGVSLTPQSPPADVLDGFIHDDNASQTDEDGLHASELTPSTLDDLRDAESALDALLAGLRGPRTSPRSTPPGPANPLESHDA